MFRVKICGITTVDDALMAMEAGADAIGLNFYEKSPRYVRPPTAAEIVSSAQAIDCIGVFVNKSPEEICNLASDVKFGWTQLHGDESPADIARIEPPAKVIRACRFRDGGTDAITQELAACQALGRLPQAVLIDAAVPGQYGGTGATISWDGLAARQAWLGNVPMILAGGLTPENVAEAIKAARPEAVDVASGVESSPGKKDGAKMRDFVEAARAALAEL